MSLQSLKFSNFRVATKLWVAVAILVCVLFTLIGFAATRSARLQAESDSRLMQIDAKLGAEARWAALTESNVARLQATVTTNDSAVDMAFKDRIAGMDAEFERIRRSIEAMPLTAYDRKLLDRATTPGRTLSNSVARVRKHKASGNNVDARAEADSVFHPAAKAYLQTLGEIEAAQETFATAAGQEQAQGIFQVSETMTQLEKVTQQNAAMVEEASAAAGSLEDQSKALAGAVAVFRLHGAGENRLG